MRSPSAPALEATSLYRFFHAGGDETLALRGVSFSVDPREVVAITGPSGSGKSTLLHCLAGLDEPDGGMVRVAGEELSRRTEAHRADIRARRIGVLFQQHNLWDHLTVAENVAVAQRLRPGPAIVPVADLLEQLHLDHRASATAAELSGGEAARAGLAVALANDPAVVLADEPTGELDSASGALVVDLLIERARRGAAVVVVTHTPAIAARADRVVALRDGVVEA